jgi:RNA-directed DNA polymerase
VYIPKPGKREKRPLGVPTVRDRTVQTALRQVIEPIFERSFAECSHGFRPERGCKDALREVDRKLKEGFLHVLEVDVCRFFDTLDHGILMERVREHITDGGVLSLIQDMLQQGVMEEGRSVSSGEGTPQGGPISPLLANIYLNSLDHLLVNAGYKLIRYADDMVILCQSRQEAERAKEVLSDWMEANRLTLHPEKTCWVDMSQRGAYVDFLGYRFLRTKSKGELRRYPSSRNNLRLRENLRPLLRRANGKSMEAIILQLNRKLKGWFEYFKHCSRQAFNGLDSWIRMRLRSILRKRHRGKGRGRGNDHIKWPNAYFAELGLFSLSTALAEVRQSARR